ncbi:MAG TPA: tripartite tricarboxylate transporter substrate binding protein [Xanthobacteraceae bacterium]|nr:tripartite tricarboxylate transporter substrate binding protein [Xanthobacteraceae bacterium]
MLMRPIGDAELRFGRKDRWLQSRLVRTGRRLMAALLLTSLSCGAAPAQEWPSRTIRAIVPLTAGSATDIVARTVLEQVSGQVGQPILIENRPGGGNTTGMAAAARATPDGYTILVNSSSHTIVPATYTDLPFDTLSDFAPIIPLGNIPTVLVVPASRGYKNLADFIAAAKAKPGAMNYSSAGAGNFSHFAAEVFRRAAGFEAVHVPSKGALEALTEVLTGRVDFFFSPLILALPFVKEGKLQALAVSGSQRALALPDVPTTVEAGYPDSTYNFWVGLFAPAKVPSAILGALYQQTAAAVKSAPVQEKLAKLGVDPMLMSSAAFAALVREEVSVNTGIAAAVGVKAN